MTMIGAITPRCTVMPASLAHVRRMGEIMRPADYAEGIALGGIPQDMLRASFRASLWSSAAFVEGELAAIWGLNGSPMGRIGTPWLITSAAMERETPQFCVSLGRLQVLNMLDVRPRLENVVDARYTKAIRFLKLLGFVVESPQPHPVTGAEFCPFWIDRDLRGG